MKLQIKRLLSYIPTSLPVGMTEFETWANDVIELAGPSLADADSMKYVLSSFIVNSDPYTSKVSKAYFVNGLRKAAAKQIAGAVFSDIRNRQQEALKAAQAQPEATSPTGTASDGNTQEV